MKSDKAYLVIFLTLIFLPLAVMLFGKQNDVWFFGGQSMTKPSWELEKSFRQKSVATKATSLYKSTNRFIKRYDSYFGQTFPFRPVLLELFTFTHTDILHTNPIPDKLVEGSAGWYFLGDSYSNDIKQSKGIQNFSNNELLHIVNKIDRQRAWLKSKGMAYYIFAAAGKLSVYGDYLQIQKSGRPTRKQQLDSASKGHFNYNILVPENIASGRPTYFKTDSHWNDLGAFQAYQMLVGLVRGEFPSVKIVKATDYKLDSSLVYQMDLTRQLGRDVPELIYSLQPRDTLALKQLPNRLQVPAGVFNPKNYERRFRSSANNLKVLVFRDSFGTNIEKFIAASFGESVFIWDHVFDEALIEREKPDIVMHIVVDRNLEVLGRGL